MLGLCHRVESTSRYTVWISLFIEGKFQEAQSLQESEMTTLACWVLFGGYGVKVSLVHNLVVAWSLFWLCPQTAALIAHYAVVWH